MSGSAQKVPTIPPSTVAKIPGPNPPKLTAIIAATVKTRKGLEPSTIGSITA